jgi:hypothetical protein
LDLLVLAIWLDIQSETYGKLVGIAFVWTFLALLVLGLTLALGTPGDIARALYLATMTSAAAAGIVSTWLIISGGRSDAALANPLNALGDDGLLRALGAAFVLIATLWVASLAASRLESSRR